LKKVGGFKHGFLTEDMEVTLRLLISGANLKYNSAAEVITQTPADWTDLFKQRTRWSQGHLQSFAEYGPLTSAPIALSFTYYIILPTLYVLSMAWLICSLVIEPAQESLVKLVVFLCAHAVLIALQKRKGMEKFSIWHLWVHQLYYQTRLAIHVAMQIPIFLMSSNKKPIVWEKPKRY
jgi:cellulose synthase/poly-beta-1,6-N-acetylglucosamine synthase-like glycosyltransferase